MRFLSLCKGQIMGGVSLRKCSQEVYLPRVLRWPSILLGRPRQPPTAVSQVRYLHRSCSHQYPLSDGCFIQVGIFSYIRRWSLKAWRYLCSMHALQGHLKIPCRTVSLTLGYGNIKPFYGVLDLSSLRMGLIQEIPRRWLTEVGLVTNVLNESQRQDPITWSRDSVIGQLCTVCLSCAKH